MTYGALAGFDLPVGDRPDRADWEILIDLQSDPGENFDVSSRYPEVLADMKARLALAKQAYEPMGLKFTPP